MVFWYWWALLLTLTIYWYLPGQKYILTCGEAVTIIEASIDDDDDDIDIIGKAVHWYWPMTGIVIYSGCDVLFPNYSDDDDRYPLWWWWLTLILMMTFWWWQWIFCNDGVDIIIWWRPGKLWPLLCDYSDDWYYYDMIWCPTHNDDVVCDDDHNYYIYYYWY